MKRLWDKGGDADELILHFTVGDDPEWDARLVAYDVRASIAHVTMLAEQILIPSDVVELLKTKLQDIGDAHARGEWTISTEEEDCHTAIENRLGELGAWVHLGRSRNDQVLAAVRLYLIDATDQLADEAERLALHLDQLPQRDLPMPGYTHMQRAMPSTVGLWASAFASEFRDDAVSLRISQRRAKKNPLGSAAGYGTPGLNLDREATTQLLRFNSTHEPVTAVQLSRGKAEASIAFECVALMIDLGRLATDLVLFSTAEFGFVRLPAAFTTGSSIMPQKRNPDVFELVRGHSAQALAALQAILALTMKMSSGYHRDLQLIKPPLFRLLDQALACTQVMSHAIPALEFDGERMAAAMDAGLFAAERAYALVIEQGIPFREAYRRIGEQFK